MKILPPIILAAAILFFGIYITGTLALYQVFPYLDSIMHFLGGVTIGWLIFAYAAQRGRTYPRLGKVLWIALVIGLGWEVAEHSSGIFFKGTEFYRYFHGGPPWDTAADVFLDLSGAGIVAALARTALHPLKRTDTQKS